jgi:hemolysin III
MAYPNSKVETVADAAIHAFGLILALPAFAFLIAHAAAGTAVSWAIWLYAACAMASFIASAIYHMSPLDRTRGMLLRIDHAAIYLKIAGSYAPVVALLGSTFAYGVFGIVWMLALLGAVAKLWFWRTDGQGSLALYLAMGWLSALLVWPMWQVLPTTAVALIVAGGLIYSAGTRVYAHPGMRFQNALWHAIVLVASSCCFAAIAISI